ncbi:MAG: hemolysin family protein [Oscillatoria sp. PMC 1068.18]|nr:hemolysin family protein [Oscillatoria sp. PMC 1076.18]MEC4988301.1 hemolysin family protein [Oscillatoria sp. PMC 1068.18]
MLIFALVFDLLADFPHVEVTGRDVLVRLLSVLLLITINAFFVTAEFSIVSVRRSRINQLVEAGDVQAQTVQSLHRSIDRLLSTTQIGITLSSLALGWIGESTMAVLVTAAMGNLPLPISMKEAIAHSLAIPIAFFLIAYLQIVLGELCPKSLALLYSEQLARFFGPPSLAIARIFNPFIWILNQSTRWLLRLGGIQYVGQGWYNRVTPEELQLIITTERESIGLEAEERELLNNVFEFGEVLAQEVMVPRTNLRAIPSTATFATLLNEVSAKGYSCYPVTGDSLDDIRGIINFKKLAKPLAKGQLSPDTPILPWVRPARFVSEFTPLSELLPLMQRSHLKMVMVVDEFGGTAGLVTLNDLVAEIIGNEAELENPEVVALQMLDEQTFLVEAQMDLEEVNELLDLDLPITDEYQTLSGFLLYELQKIPTQGETLYFDNLELTVVAAEGPRLHKIRIHKPEANAEQLAKIVTLEEPIIFEENSSPETTLDATDEES